MPHRLGVFFSGERQALREALAEPLSGAPGSDFPAAIEAANLVAAELAARAGRCVELHGIASDRSEEFNEQRTVCLQRRLTVIVRRYAPLATEAAQGAS